MRAAQRLLYHSPPGEHNVQTAPYSSPNTP